MKKKIEDYEKEARAIAEKFFTSMKDINLLEDVTHVELTAIARMSKANLKVTASTNWKSEYTKQKNRLDRFVDSYWAAVDGATNDLMRAAIEAGKKRKKVNDREEKYRKKAEKSLKRIGDLIPRGGVTLRVIMS